MLPVNRNAATIARQIRSNAVTIFQVLPSTISIFEFAIGNPDGAVAASPFTNCKLQIAELMLVLRRRDAGILQRLVERGPHLIRSATAPSSFCPLTNSAGVASTPTLSPSRMEARTAFSSCALTHACNFAMSRLCFWPCAVASRSSSAFEPSSPFRGDRRADCRAGNRHTPNRRRRFARPGNSRPPPHAPPRDASLRADNLCR